MNERELSIIRALGEEFATVLADLQRTFEEKMSAQAQAFEEKLASLSALLQKHVTVDEVSPVLQAMVDDAVGAIPLPRDGRDYDPEVLKQAVNDAVAKIPVPADGKSITPDDVRPMLEQMVKEAADGQYLAQAKWDTPRVVKGVSFSLRLTSGRGDDSRLVTTAITADTAHRFSGLPPGEYTLTVRAINSYGQQGEPATTTFRIDAPAAPATIELIPGYFQITAVPKLAVYDPTVQFEFWFSEDANDKWNAMWGVRIEQTEDGKHYVAGLGLSMEDTEDGKLSQFLVAANRIAFIDPANGNETPMFVAQGNQIFMNDVFLKYLTAPTITSGGNPPAFSLTPDGRLTAKNADISGNVNANSGTLNNVTINENCRVLGKLSANQIEGDLVKTVGKAFPRDSRAPERWPSGTITVRVYDDQPFDRQIVIPAVAFSGAKHKREHTDIYSSCRLIVRKNGAEIYNRTALDNTLIYSGVIDMPAGHGHMTLEFSVSAWLVNDWYPTASISDLLVVVMKKATAGISIS